MRATERYLKPLIAAGALAGLLLCCVAGYAQTPKPTTKVIVTDVKVEGNRVVPSQEILGMLKTRPGTEYKAQTVEDDSRALVAAKKVAFAEAYPIYSADRKEVVVVFAVRDYPSVVRNVIYKGNKHVGNEEELTTITGIRRGSPLNPVANAMACKEIVRKLNDQGRPFAECFLESGADPNDVDVIFNITEGDKVLISGIDFTFTHEPSFVGKQRLATLLNSSAGWLHLFRGTYNENMVEADISKLIEYYKSFGYLDVRVGRELYRENGAREVVLVFHIDEGRRYQIKDRPQVSGNKSQPVDALEQLVLVQPHEFYDEKKIKADTDHIRDWYGHLGQEARVSANPVFSRDEPGIVTMHYEVQEQAPARVGDITIIGNNRTKFNVIERQLDPLLPGQVLDYPSIRQAERNLARLGIFETAEGDKPTITVKDNPLNPDSEYKDIIVNVKEASSGSLLFGVGVNSDAGLTGSIVLNERNFDITRLPTSWEDLFSGNAFRGAGQEFRIEAVPGTQLQRYTVSWREPFLFDSLFSLGVSAYYYERQYNEDMESRLGTKITLGRKLNPYWTLSLGLRVENVAINDVPINAPEDYQSVEGNNFLAGASIALTRDDRDSPLRPTEGGLLSMSFEQCFGSYTFALANLEYSRYFTTFQRADGSGRQVIALHSQASWASSDTPVYERYYAGGFRSMRGFEFRGVGPDVNGFKVGGDFQFLNSVEYQVPLKANDQIYFVGFVDSGTVESSVEIKNYRVAAGFGVRFTVPMLGPVPIALDFGFPIVKADFDNKQMFSFWLGFFR